jgi:hypothetical protein
MRSKSEVVGTLRSLPQFLESIKNQISALDLMFGRGEHAAWPAWLGEGIEFPMLRVRARL